MPLSSSPSRDCRSFPRAELSPRRSSGSTNITSIRSCRPILTDAVPLAARRIAGAFAEYNAEFRAITRRAPVRFDTRDWKGGQRDAVARIELYDSFVARTVAELRALLGTQAENRELWMSIRADFAARIEGVPDAEFIKTFFSSISRRLFGTVGVAPDIEFVATDLDPLARVGPRQQHPPRGQRGAAAPCGSPRAAGGAARRSDPPGLLPDLPRLHRRAADWTGLPGAAGDSAQELGWRRARRCGDARRGRCQHRIQLLTLLLPRGSRARCGSRGVPQVPDASQAGERALHRVGARQTGQDGALP